MSRRKKLVWRYALVSLGLALLVSVYAVWAEWSRREDPSMLAAVEGITDELGRTLPPDHPRVQFVDVATEAGIDFVHFAGARQHLLPEDMGSGAAWGDFDGDGDDDLYVVNFAGPLGEGDPATLPGRPNALYRNDGDGRFSDVAAAAGVAVKGWFMGAFWADYDNDGDLDLYVTGYRGNHLYRNEGQGRFSDQTEKARVRNGRWSTGAAWGDYDGDGWLDLYVCNYVEFRSEAAGSGGQVQQYGYAVPYTLNPATYDPAPNALYRNNQDGTFTDVAPELGVTDPEGRSLVAAFADLDDDGDQDLYVADDVSKNALYRNKGDGSFEEWSAQSLAADYRGAMGLGIGDYDQDDDLDIFITHWIAQENALYQNALRGVPATGQLQFFDIADQVGVGAPGLQRVSWGTSFLDYDNDGRLDLFVVNGHTFEDKADATRLVPQRMQVFWNKHPEGFFDTTVAAGPALKREVVGRGAAFADHDLDGDVDVFVTVNGGRPLLLRNDGGSHSASIGFDLKGIKSNAQGLGARLRLRAGGTTRLLPVGAQGPYLSGNSPRAWFGLGSTRPEQLEVRWPSGTVEEITGLEPGRIYTLTEGKGRDQGRSLK